MGIGWTGTSIGGLSPPLSRPIRVETLGTEEDGRLVTHVRHLDNMHIGWNGEVGGCCSCLQLPVIHCQAQSCELSMHPYDHLYPNNEVERMHSPSTFKSSSLATKCTPLSLQLSCLGTSPPPPLFLTWQVLGEMGINPCHGANNWLHILILANCILTSPIHNHSLRTLR